MSGRYFSQHRFLLYAAATLLAAAAATYSATWISHIAKWTVPPGISNYEYSAGNRQITIGEVFPGSPADQAGLHAGDSITTINGRALDTLMPLYKAMILTPASGVIDVHATCPGRPGSRHVRLVLGSRPHEPLRITRLQQLLYLPISFYPLGFLIVGMTVLFLRLDDGNAWLLALLFASWMGGGPLREGLVTPELRGFAVFYKIAAWAFIGPLFYYFFAVFPARSTIDRKLPWLKHLAVWANLILFVPLAVRCFIAGGSSPLYAAATWPGARFMLWLVAGQGGMPAPALRFWPNLALWFFADFVCLTALGFVSLAFNVRNSADADARRKARFIVWGTVLGVGPALAGSLMLSMGVGGRIPLFGWQAMVVLLSWVWPFSFAYAVVKHRVLEIPILLRRSARYVVVQRGFAILLLLGAAIAIAVFTNTFARFFPEYLGAGMALSAVFGIVLVWSSAPLIRRGTDRIDRAFFRSAYDVRQILETLVKKTARAGGRDKLAELLDSEISQALHPTFLAIYLADDSGQLHLERFGPDSNLPTLLSPGTQFLREIARRGEPSQFAGQQRETEALFGPLQPECLVPILTADGGLSGLLALGGRRSEEPYSAEDNRLLGSVASQAAVALDNIRLAESIAKRLEAERRIAMEMEFARQVQARLFPQRTPELATLDYSGTCIQARQVGGDYYDFLELRPGRMALVVADVAGKGVSGALMMANLQANLRSQYAIALEDLSRLLSSVNRLFYTNSGDNSYATLFFADYDDSTRSLRYVNCGHLPPLLLRASQGPADQQCAGCRVEKLESTSTVLGLFEHWECVSAEVQLYPGDILLLYTDGVTEAEGPGEEEFGEARLLQTLRTHRDLPVPLLQSAIIAAIQEFATGEQHDDITLVLARCREAPTRQSQ